MSKAKKYILVVLLVAVVVGAGYLNWRMGLSQTTDNDSGIGAVEDENKNDQDTTGSDTDTTTTTTGDYFADYKNNRETARQKEISYLDAIINDTNTDAETLADAQSMKLQIVAAMEMELKLEGLLNAKGIGETLVTVQSGSVNIVVNVKEITDTQAAQILDIVQSETKEPAKNIKIIPQG